MLGRKSRIGTRPTNAYITLNGNFGSFVCLVLVRLLRPSMVILYHENGKLQRAYYTEGKEKVKNMLYHLFLVISSVR